MIIIHVMGGIGNQLYQYAIGRSLALRHNTELKLDITQCAAEKFTHHNYYRLGDFNIQENFATVDEIRSMTLVYEQKLRKDTSTQFIEEVFGLPDNILLYGYWQSDRYFAEIADILRAELTLRNPLSRMAVYWEDKISAADCPVSLHFRHGDYLTPLIRNNSSYGKILPLDYYDKCVAELKKSERNITLFVFSDDLQWAKGNLGFDVPIEFVEGCEKDCEDLYLMSLCKHNVIVDSTFSWWGAWLNRNPDKKVFAPCRSESDFDKLPSNWTGVSIDFSQKPHLYFPPLLSIILYADNNAADTIAMTISIITSQSMQDYELVILCADDSNIERVCRQFATVAGVNFLKLNHNADEFMAYNTGLDCVCGEYVLLLDGKGIIFPDTIKSLAQFTYNYLKRYIEPGGHYITYASYGECDPNVICLTQMLAESNDGNVTVNGLPNRNFSVLTDTPFKNLNTFVDANIDDRQKLMLLASEQLNNDLGTKFFKRKFLNEHNIRFDEHQQGGVVLKFLTDAFLSTEKITLVPQLFYGRLK